MSGPNDKQAGFWEELAPTWVELDDQLETISAPFGLLAMEQLSLHGGQRVLDLGCGSGATTLELARRVGSSGQVVAVDIAPTMLARARQRAKAAATTNVRFVEADVQVTELGDSNFDAAFSRFGVMFFSDPVTAFGNVRRALRPGGTLAFVCWQEIFANEWMLVPGAAVVTVTGSLPPMPGPDEPGPFSLSDRTRLEGVLQSAGFQPVEVREHSQPVVLDKARLDDAVQLSMRIGAAREALRDADDDTRRRALAAVRDAFTSRIDNGEVRLSAGVFVVNATA